MDCIFCKIIKGEIPSAKVFENEKIVAFNDINPKAKIHVLIVPKKHIESVKQLEAACLGVPVLVSENMGCGEILKKVGLSNMVVSFDDIANVADGVERLCDQEILPKQLNDLKKLLDTNFVSEEIRKVLDDTVRKNEKNS